MKTIFSPWWCAVTLTVSFLTAPTRAASPPTSLAQLLRRPLNADLARQQTEAIEIARRAAAEHPTPGTWDSAIYLPYAVPNDLLSRFVGIEIASDLEGLPSVSLTLTTAKITGGWGEAKVDIGLRVGTSFSNDTAELVTKGRLLYRGYAEKESGTVSAVFGIALDPPLATAKVKGKTFSTPEWITKLVAAGIMKLLEDQLTFALPIPMDFSRPVGYDDEAKLRAGDQGWVKIRVTAPGATLRKRVDEFAPVFVPSGLWLCVQFEGRPKMEAAASPTKIEDALAKYENEGGDGAKLVVHGKFLEGVVNGLGELPAAARTAKAVIVDHGGKLFNSGGDINVQVWASESRWRRLAHGSAVGGMEG